MVKFEKVPLERLRLLGKVSSEKLKVIEEYQGYIEQLGEKEGGIFTVEKGEDLKEVRSDLKKAAALAEKKLTSKVVGNQIHFAIQQEKKRGRPKGKKKEKKEEDGSET